MWRKRLVFVGGLAVLGSTVALLTAGARLVDNHVFWYLSRATGLGAFVLLTLDVCLGIAIRTRVGEPVLARWRVTDLHEFTALLALGLTAMHTLVLLYDRYIGFSLVQLLVPLVASYRPVWTGLGVLSLYLLILTTASWYVRGTLGYRTWRALHYLTFGAYVLALLHGMLAGTDTGRVWARLLYWASAVIVGALTLHRLGETTDSTTGDGNGQRPDGGTRPALVRVSIPVEAGFDGRRPAAPPRRLSS
jgi:sulfoxide reductase heme-binding subunit YedZ